MENEYKVSFAEFLEKKQGSIRQRYCEINGFIFGHEMTARSFSVMHNNEEIAFVKGSTEGKISFAPILVRFLNRVSSDSKVMNNILKYSLKDGARRFTVMTYEEYTEALLLAQEERKEKSFKNSIRVKEFVSGRKKYCLSADVNICEQMEFCCEIIPEDKRREWYFCAVPPFEASNSKEFVAECNKLDEKIRKNRAKGIREINRAYINGKKKDKCKGEVKTEKRVSRKASTPRDPVIVSMAKIIANGVCELSDSKGELHNAPIFEGYGVYLEVHHVKWLSSGGTDTLDNVVALCPVCHRKMHIAASKEDVRKLRERAKQHEKDWIKIMQQNNEE